jgi:Zn-dependent peptidase ImmA (M78 family)
MATRATEPLWLRIRTGTSRWSAERLLKHFGMITPPVPVLQLANLMGASVFYSESAAFAGAVDVDAAAQRARIYVRRTDPHTRQRFTIAHEIGHLVLHRTSLAMRYDYNFNEGPEEAQANGYAAALLIPMWMLAEYAPTYDHKVAPLAELFDVSREAMNIRLRKLVTGAADRGFDT